MEKLAIGTALMLSLSVQVNAQPLGQQLTDQHWAARGPLMQCIYPFGLSQIGLMTTPYDVHKRVLQGCTKEINNLDEYVIKNGIDKNRYGSLAVVVNSI